MYLNQLASRFHYVLSSLLLLAAGCQLGDPTPANRKVGETASAPETSLSNPAVPQNVADKKVQPPAEERPPGEREFAHPTGAGARPLTAVLPRSARYGGLRFTVTKGTITDQPPTSLRRRAGAEQAYACLDVSIHNELDSTTFSGLSPGLVKLQLVDGAFGSPLTDDWLLELTPRATEAVTLVYAVPKDRRWEGAVMVVSQEQEEPETLVLDGPVPAQRYPEAITLPKTTALTAGDFACQLTAVTLDVEHQHKRAPQGQRYLKFDVRLTYEGKTLSAGFQGDRQFRLRAVGAPARAVAYPLENLAPNMPVDSEAVYLIPAGTKEIELQFGDNDETAKRVNVGLAPKR